MFSITFAGQSSMYRVEFDSGCRKQNVKKVLFCSFKNKMDLKILKVTINSNKIFAFLKARTFYWENLYLFQKNCTTTAEYFPEPKSTLFYSICNLTRNADNPVNSHHLYSCIPYSVQVFFIRLDEFQTLNFDQISQFSFTHLCMHTEIARYYTANCNYTTRRYLTNGIPPFVFHCYVPLLCNLLPRNLELCWRKQMEYFALTHWDTFTAFLW